MTAGTSTLGIINVPAVRDETGLVLMLRGRRGSAVPAEHMSPSQLAELRATFRPVPWSPPVRDDDWTLL